MRIVITCGPSYEPVDEVRRLTNFSTGELGVMLANRFVAAGHDVLCFKGEAATYPGECAAQVTPFSTNEDLLQKLQTVAAGEAVQAVFHCAALCDFKVKRVETSTGEKLTERKVSSRAGDLVIVLEPAGKVIAHLRELFPDAWIVGWKYELDGSRPDALAKGWQQIQENRVDACVVNGRAVAHVFELCEQPREITTLPDKESLANWLAARVQAGAK